MDFLLRRPNRYLAVHWTVTLGLAAALFAPNFAGHDQPAADQIVGGPGASVTLPTGQVVRLDAAGMPTAWQAAAGDAQGDAARRSGLRIGQLFGPDQYALPSAIPDSSIGEYTPPQPAACPSGGFCRFVSSPRGNMFESQLFDLTTLVADGYDDAHSDSVPVIVRFATPELARQAVARGLVDGIHFTKSFEYLPDAAGYISKRGPFLSSDPLVAADAGIANVALDGLVQLAPGESGDSAADLAPLMQETRELIHADAAAKAGLFGKGIKIAVVDTGIDANHADLKGRVIAAQDFTPDKEPLDRHGHGTHVAGIAAGTGALSDGKYGGVAPQAQLINAKGLTRTGSGRDTWIISAMEWAADQGARVINMSLGGGASDGTDSLSQAVNSITAKKNVLFVIAAGNAGPRGKVSTPAAANSALAVGAIDKQKVLAPFSSRGPRLGDYALKPEIVTPGVRITAPRANPGDGDPYWTISGTSMASPVTAGSAALVFQLHPSWTPAQVKNALMSSADPIGGQCEVGAYDQGAGLVNLANIVAQKAVMEPAGISLGQLKGGKGEATVKITNISSAELQLEPGGQLCGPEGAVAGALEFSEAAFKLPAGGSVSLKLRVNGITDPGQYSGVLQFLAGEDRVAQGAVAFVVR